MPPARSATASACRFTASSSRASTAATSTAAPVTDLAGDRLQRCTAAARKEDRRTLARESPRDRAPDRASRAVDDRVLVGEEHVSLVLVVTDRDRCHARDRASLERVTW
jgi:hypothetical protein